MKMPRDKDYAVRELAERVRLERALPLDGVKTDLLRVMPELKTNPKGLEELASFLQEMIITAAKSRAGTGRRTGLARKKKK